MSKFDRFVMTLLVGSYVSSLFLAELKTAIRGGYKVFFVVDTSTRWVNIYILNSSLISKAFKLHCAKILLGSSMHLWPTHNI